MKEVGAQHPTSAHVIGVKYLKVITCFVTKTKALSALHTCLTLQEDDVTKKCVIISEISKEVENNTITRLNVHQKQYVSRRNGAAGGSYGRGGSSGRS